MEVGDLGAPKADMNERTMQGISIRGCLGSMCLTSRTTHSVGPETLWPRWPRGLIRPKNANGKLVVTKETCFDDKDQGGFGRMSFLRSYRAEKALTPIRG